MMRSTKSSTLFAVSHEDWAIWPQQLHSETERGLATTAATILDHLMARLIEYFLFNDPNATKRLLGHPFPPVGSFAARTAADFSLVLISKDEWDYLDYIRDIREDFALQPTRLSFSEQSIANKVNNLKIPKLILSEILDRSTESPLLP